MDAADWDARYAENDLWWSVEANRFVMGELGGLSAGRALDLGTGEGRNALWLAERGWEVTALDFSAVAIEKGRRLADDQGVTVDWLVADALTHRPDPDSLDLVLISFLQLPPDDLAVVIETAVNALAPGGTFLLVAHDRRNLEDGVGGPQDPALLTQTDEIVALLETLDIEHAGAVERTVDTDDGPRTAIDTLVRARR